ncbi:glycoside hydrolase [Actinophytocola sp.]|uniref:glycoside hydrolase n=1 Tax=Actinophytocola sp. TaxID=1872138 RepID=UPI002D7EF0D1|nr:glycoside hydrolase [Actinophytocola sp.]HET9143795.1 glycoside hydrolase [Actinophytocola sp.]
MAREVGRRAVLAAAGAAAAGTVLAGTARADQTVLVDPVADFGRWEGWGTSLAWWANVFGDRDDLADLWFTTRTVTYQGIPLPGLGMNIARYNLGACGFNTVLGERMVASPNIPPFKQIEGYWQDWTNEDPNSAAWNWSVDARQRAALVKAVARGAIAELFANSPMWWMCLNHNPSGAANAGNNLQSWNYRQHAAHLAAVAQRARTSWGVTFRTVEAFNEATSNFWRADGSQEGCHIDAAIQRTILGHLRSELNLRGLSGTMIAASDETNYDVARATWASYDPATRALVNQVNVHGYQGSGGRRDLLYNDVRAAGKILWNSETGDNDGTGLSMARNILLDLRWLHPTAWVFWQVMDPSPNWALIHYDPNTLRSGAVQTKLYVLAQFTRHIRPGMRIIGTAVDNAAAAYDPAARRLVLVGANPGAAQTITFDLSRFATVPATPVARWTTVPAGADRYVQRTDLRPNGRLLAVPFPAGSVQTVQIDGVA